MGNFDSWMLLHSWGHNMFWTKVTISLLEVVLGLLQPIHPVSDLQIDLRLRKMVPNDSPYPNTLGLTPKSSLQNVQKQGCTCYYIPWSCPWPPTAPPTCSWSSDWSEAPKWFPIPKNMGFDTKIKSLACSEPKLRFHSSKLSAASYSPSTLFLTFRSISGSRKWSQMIPHTQKPGVSHQNQVSSMARSKVIIIWHSISLGPAGPQEGDFEEKSGNFKWLALIKMSQFFCQ